MIKHLPFFPSLLSKFFRLKWQSESIKSDATKQHYNSEPTNKGFAVCKCIRRVLNCVFCVCKIMTDNAGSNYSGEAENNLLLPHCVQKLFPIFFKFVSKKKKCTKLIGQ